MIALEIACKQQMIQEPVLALNPQMLQAIHILQMPSDELFDYLLKEAEENPLLSFDILDNAEKRRQTAAVEYEKFDPLLYAESEEDPLEILRLQIATSAISVDIERLGCALLEMLDQNGCIDRKVLDNMCKNGVNPGQLQQAMELLRSLEPAGIGAYDVQDCLLLQLDRIGENGGLAYQIIHEHFGLLTNNQLPSIARRLSIPVSRVVLAVNLIRSLNPKPFSEFTRRDLYRYIIPDILIRKRPEGHYEILLNQLGEDSIAVDQSYAELVNDFDSMTEHAYVNEKIEKIKWLQTCLEHRRKTISACAARILAVQMSFFENGPDAIQAYSRKKLARELNIHESTVCRALKDKYIDCKWGVFPLSLFFSQPAVLNNTIVSRDSVYKAIKRIIASEDPQSPVSDDAISELLGKDGYSVKRRTVTKYRETLGIPSAAKRKVFDGIK